MTTNNKIADNYDIFMNAIRSMYSKNDVYLRVNIWNEFLSKNIDSENLLHYIISKNKMAFLVICLAILPPLI